MCRDRDIFLGLFGSWDCKLVPVSWKAIRQSVREPLKYPSPGKKKILNREKPTWAKMFNVQGGHNHLPYIPSVLLSGGPSI